MHPYFNPARKLFLGAALCCLAGLASAQPIQLAMIEGLSGPFGNTGEAAYRNLVMAVLTTFCKAIARRWRRV